MFRLWGKTFYNNHMLCDFVYEDDSAETRTHKVLRGLEVICNEFDLSSPIWLDANIAEFKQHAHTRFYPDNFIDGVDFDYLEIRVIEED